MAEIYQHPENKKYYIRRGTCNQCGFCCTGFAEPCEFLEIGEYGKTKCKVHSIRNTPEGKKLFEEGRMKCNSSGSNLFPDGPQALESNEAFNSCSYWFEEIENILIAAPIYDGKEYCLEQYLEAVKKLDYPKINLLLVDNSEKDTFYKKWRDKIPGLIRLEMPNETPNKRIALSMEYIRKYFLANDYTRWFNLEVDVIVPPDILVELLKYDRNKDLDWISHTYPDRTDPKNIMSGFGCSLFSRNIMEKTDFVDAPSDRTTDGWYWNNKVRGKGFKVVEVWEILKLEHLNGNENTTRNKHLL